MRILFSCTAGEGHFQPLVPVARAAATLGHSVAFATSPDFAPRAREAGFDTLEAGITVDELERRFAPRRDALQSLDVPVPERRVLAFTWRFAETEAPAKADALLRVGREWRPDLVVHESADLSAPLVAAALDLPSVNHSFGRAIPLAALRSAATSVAPIWQRLGVEPDELAGAYRGPYVDICPPSMQGDEPPAGARVQPMRPAQRAPGNPDGPLLYATLGTIFNRPERFRTLLDAFDELECPVLLTVGRNVDPSSLGPARRHVTIERYVPQAEVLPRATAALSHGGSGSTWAALAHGLPLVLLPEGADQFENALACTAVGAAVTLMPPEQNAESIRDAAAAVLEQDAFRDSAARIAAEIAAMPSPEEVAARLETWARTSVD